MRRFVLAAVVLPTIPKGAGHGRAFKAHLAHAGRIQIVLRYSPIHLTHHLTAAQRGA